MTRGRLRLLSAEAGGVIGDGFLRGEADVDVGTFTTDFHREVSLEPCSRIVAEVMRRFDERSPQDSDSWLAPRMHASLRLTPREAGDLRIWNYLAVDRFPDYVRWRWSRKDTVARDRFLGTTYKNALARLWWGAELTRNGSDYGPTVEAFRVQDIPNTWFRVDFAHNRAMVLAGLRLMKRLRGGRLPDGTRAKATRKVNRLSTAINVALTATSLDVFLPYRGTDAKAFESWIHEQFDVNDFLDAMPSGPPEDPVSDRDLQVAESFVRRIADEAGIFHDQTGEPLFS